MRTLLFPIALLLLAPAPVLAQPAPAPAPVAGAAFEADRADILAMAGTY